MSRINKLTKLFRKNSPRRSRKWAKACAARALIDNPWIAADLRNNPYFWVL